MVSVDEGFVRVSYEIWLPGRKSMYNGKKFLVVDIPISLRGIERSGKESNQVELAFLIPLLKCHDIAILLGRFFFSSTCFSLLSCTILRP